LARTLGYRYALVLTGVISAEEATLVDPPPDEVAPDLATVVARYGING
jgi:hypothetical protein